MTSNPLDNRTGQIVFSNIYSRLIKGKKETWEDLMSRMQRYLTDNGGISNENLKEITTRLNDLKINCSGRAMWVGGTDWSRKPEGIYGLNNCYAFTMHNLETFGLAMELLMCGGGVGVNYEQKYIDKLPKIVNRFDTQVIAQPGERLKNDRRENTILIYSESQAKIVIEVGDSRTAWANALMSLINVATDTTRNVKFVDLDFSSVRPAGDTIKGFGGVSSPQLLCINYVKIANLLKNAKYFTDICCEKIMGLIAEIVVAGGVRRCIAKDSLVNTAKGLVPIQDLVVGDLVLTPKGFKPVTATFVQGSQDVLEIITNGIQPRVTNNHRLAVQNQYNEEVRWVMAKDLVPGDQLVHFNKATDGVKTSLPFDFTEQRPANSRTSQELIIPELTADVSWLIGLIHGNGYIYLGKDKEGKPHGRVSISGNGLQPELTLAIFHKAEKVLNRFGAKTKVKAIKGENTLVLKITHIRLAEYLHHFVKKPCTPLVIPSWILQGTLEVRAGYLAGLMDSDGAINNRPVCLVTTVYRKFSQQVAALYSSLGIVTRISVNRPKEENWQDKYNVNLPALKDRYNLTVAPYSIKGSVKVGLKREGFKIRTQGLSETFGYTKMKKASLNSHSDYQNWEAVNDRLVVLSTIPVTVKEVSIYKQLETFDIEVADGNCFYCEGILTHNSARLSLYTPSSGFADLKQDLYVQDLLGNWSIDPERSMCTNANHTAVYKENPDLETVISSVRNQWKSGEGAILNRKEVATRVGKPGGQDSYTANPCVTADTWVMTDQGVRQVKQLIGEQFVAIVQGKPYPTTSEGFFYSGCKLVYRLDTVEGSSIKLTKNHKLLTTKGWKEAGDLIPGDLLVMHNHFDVKGLILSTFDSLVHVSIEDVYDCTVPVVHCFDANGFVAHNCLEIIGIDGLACNLSNVQLSRHTESNHEDLNKSFYCAGQVAASLLMRKFPNERLQKSRELDPIVGVSFTGVIDFFVNLGGREYIQWWLDGRVKGDKFRSMEIMYFSMWKQAASKGVTEFCKANNLKIPNRITTVQPSGSVSLLTGGSPGIHWPKATRYIRRLTMPANSPIALAAQKQGMIIIPSAKDKDSEGKLLNDPFDPSCTEWMVEVPVEVSWASEAEGLDLNKIPATAQLDFSLVAMNHYADHTVSQTLELWEEEIEPLAEAIYNAIKDDKGYVSTAILPRFDAVSSPFPRLPFEPCSKEEYDRRVALLTEEDTNYNLEVDGQGSGCDGQICEMKK